MLFCVTNLYNPDAELIVALVDADVFMCKELTDWSLGLHNLGLQDALTWEALLNCVQSIKAKELLD